MPRPAPRRRRSEELLLLLLCCAVALPLGIVPGQDGNWDLRNYHFYNPYAWLHHRLDVDVAPAQVQTWISPLWDAVPYALMRSEVPSRLTTGLLAIPAALALFAILLAARRLSPGLAGGWSLAAIVAMAATGAASMPTMGTTMSEWHVTALVVCAVWLLLAPGEGADRLLVVALAGLAGGAAAGFKLTAVPFAAGLAALTLVLRRGARVASLAALGAGGVVGFLAVYGAWGWELYRRTGNPFFPFFNDVFHSPLVHDLAYRDNRFVGRGLAHVLSLPVLLAREKAGLVVEHPIRELRIALGFAALVLLSLRNRTSDPGERTRWRGVLAFFGVSYLLWATGFGYMRYAGALELVASAAIAVAVATLLERRRAAWRVAALAAVSAFVVATTKWLDAGRIPHGPSAVQAEVPALPSRALVVIATLEPVAYVVPSLPPEVPVLSLVNNFMRLEERPTMLQELALRRVREHEGPLLLLAKRGNEKELYVSGTVEAGGDPVFGMLERMGLSPEMDRCAPIRTPLDGEALALCALEKRPAARAGR